jgi:hypothetical protein
MNGNGYTFEALLTQVIRKMWDVEIMGISGKRRENVGQ